MKRHILIQPVGPGTKTGTDWVALRSHEFKLARMRYLIALIACLLVSSPALAQQKPGMVSPDVPRAEDLLQGQPPDGEANAFLIAPFIDFNEREREFFLQNVVPVLTVDHAMTNTGSEASPWYCFAYSDAVSADYGRRTVRAMRGGETLGAKLLIDTSCAAG